MKSRAWPCPYLSQLLVPGQTQHSPLPCSLFRPPLHPHGGLLFSGVQHPRLSCSFQCFQAHPPYLVTTSTPRKGMFAYTTPGLLTLYWPALRPPHPGHTALFSLQSFQPPSALCSGNSHRLVFLLSPSFPHSSCFRVPGIHSFLCSWLWPSSSLTCSQHPLYPDPKPHGNRAVPTLPILIPPLLPCKTQKSSWCIMEDRNVGNEWLAGGRDSHIPSFSVCSDGPFLRRKPRRLCFGNPFHGKAQGRC